VNGDRGVLLVAIGAEAYVAQACLAAASVKRHAPHVPVLAATDRPDHPLLHAGFIDRVERLTCVDATRYPLAHGGPLLDRVRLLARSPFERTLHLDVDARLCVPRLDEMFDALERVDIALAEAAPDASFDRQHYGRPLFNNGIILWRGTPAVRTLLERFAATFADFLERARAENPVAPAALAHVVDAALLRRLLCSDQVALGEWFRPDHNPLGLTYAVLGEHWNWRGGVAGRRPFEALVIDHHPDLRQGAERQLATLAYDTLAAGDGRRAAALYDWLLASLVPDLHAADGVTAAARLGDASGADLARALLAAPSPPANLSSLLRVAAFHATLGEDGRAVALLRALAVRGR